MNATKERKPRGAKKAQGQVEEAVRAKIADAPLHGQIVSWDMGGVSHPFATVRDALKDAGLDEKVAREFQWRNGFARACRALSEERIIRQVKDDQGCLEFQFTREALVGDRLEYAFEAILRLNKESGDVACNVPELAARAKAELDARMGVRTPSDVTTIISRLFAQNADLFPIRRQGGAYFVPQSAADFLEKIDAFVRRLHGEIQRFPVPAGTSHGDRSVREAVTAGLGAMIEEHRQAVTSFGEDTRESTLERAAERIKITRHKIDAYACYLESEAERLKKELEEAAGALKARVLLLAEVKSADFTVECDHCQAPNAAHEGDPKTTCKACGKEFPLEW